MNKNIELFGLFFKLGLITFGGGYAMIPQIKESIVEKKEWITEDDMLEIIAIAESTPGPIAINMATYIGYKQNKVLGSICATLGVVLPSLIIIYLISLVLDAFMANQYVQYAFIGINAAVAFLIIKAGLGMIKKLPRRAIPIVVCLSVFTLALLFKFLQVGFSSIYFIIIGGVIGIMLYSFSHMHDVEPKVKRGKKKNKKHRRKQ